MASASFEGTSSRRFFVDTRWRGAHGIGRFATEVISRLQIPFEPIAATGNPAAASDALKTAWALRSVRSSDLYFTPGFNAPLTAKVRTLLTVHDLIHLECRAERSLAKTAYYMGIVRRTIRQNDTCVTVSPYSAGRIADWAGIPRHKIHVVGNGVDPVFSVAAGKWNPGFPYILYVGNLKAHKNFDVLLKALAARQSSSADLHLVVVSSGITDEWRRKIAGLGLNDRVHWLHDISDRNLAEVYRGAITLVLPSLYEGFGLPLIEAMACGTPVIGARATAIPDVCGDAACYFSPLDVDELIQLINRVTDDASLRATLIYKGLEKAKSYTWDNVGRRLRRSIEEVWTA